MSIQLSYSGDPPLFRIAFDGDLLKRGFWLYVWKIDSPNNSVLYVGRTGDSSSPNAASPFNRIGQHLNTKHHAKGNALFRLLAKMKIKPTECAFEMIAIGPLFAEQNDMAAHKPFRDRTAALEKELAVLLRDRGYHVIGNHLCLQTADITMIEAIARVLDPIFPALD